MIKDEKFKETSPTVEGSVNEGVADEKFTFADFDKLELKSFAEGLFDIIEKGFNSDTEKGAYTISLNAFFGNGKTVFLKMFKNFIEKKNSNGQENYQVMFIDAWDSDFYTEPLISILSDFKKYLESKNDPGSKKIIETIKEVGIELFKSTGNTLLAKSICVDVRKAVKAVKSKNQIDVFKELEDRKNLLKEVGSEISKYLKESNQKLIVLVDELDRARPDYAVRFLEDIKHFFDIEYVCFIFAVNKNQIEATVKQLYGESLDFDGYYRKFFKREISLPDPYREAIRFVSALMKKKRIQMLKPSKKIVYSFFEKFNLTLREIEIFMRIFENSIEETEYDRCHIIAYSFFISLSLKDKESFQKMKNEEFSAEDFIKFSTEKFGINKNNYDFNYGLAYVSLFFIYDSHLVGNHLNKICQTLQISVSEIDNDIIRAMQIHGIKASGICNKIESLAVKKQ